MNQASLYHRANELQRHDAKQILTEYSSMFSWRSDGQDTLLDIGTGSGDVMIELIQPLMPDTFKCLIGCDISSKMINYAKQNYKRHRKCHFQVLDIGVDMENRELGSKLQGKIDHVTSFYCLHWIRNQRQALKNIYNFLRPEGGDTLLVFLATNPIFDVYKFLSKMPKWSLFMQDVDNYISPLHYSNDPKKEFEKTLIEAGFKNYEIEIRQRTYSYYCPKVLKDNIGAVCPFLERIPVQMHEEFWKNLFETVSMLNLQQDNGSSSKFTVTYQLVVAYAQRTAEIEKLHLNFNHTSNFSGNNDKTR